MIAQTSWNKSGQLRKSLQKDSNVVMILSAENRVPPRDGVQESPNYHPVNPSSRAAWASWANLVGGQSPQSFLRINPARPDLLTVPGVRLVRALRGRARPPTMGKEACPARRGF